MYNKTELDAIRKGNEIENASTKGRNSLGAALWVKPGQKIKLQCTDVVCWSMCSLSWSRDRILIQRIRMRIQPTAPKACNRLACLACMHDSNKKLHTKNCHASTLYCNWCFWMTLPCQPPPKLIKVRWSTSSLWTWESLNTIMWQRSCTLRRIGDLVQNIAPC